MSMPAVKTWPTLYKTGSGGKEQQWTISVVGHDSGSGADIITVHGQVDGKQQESRVSIAVGKNIGRANETSPQAQAISESESKWLKQLDKGYSEARGGASKEHKPMLAHVYEDHKHKVDFSKPAFIQPKLDGVRAIAVRNGDEITLTSRNGKPHVGLQHIRDELLTLMGDGEAWDGELYRHGMMFQTIISLVKKDQPESVNVQYHVYDVVNPNEDFEFRYGCKILTEFGAPLLDKINIQRAGGSVVLVGSLMVESHDEVEEYHERFVGQGYEGVMLRHGGCTYKQGSRSHELLKVKAFCDGEFEIVDVVPGIGKMADQGIFVCKTTEGVEFRAKPKGRDTLRQEYLTNKLNYIGRHLTVQYFSMTDSVPAAPRFPIGIAVREDL